jgi:hypothetical protein
MTKRGNVMARWNTTAILFMVAMSLPNSAAAQPAYRSHQPLRPLPAASHRPLDKGPAYFVDPVNGDDRQSGTREKPWKTINYAAKKLKPRATLYLRGGIYWEKVVARLTGSAEAPITIRSYPGELAILDAGHREFFEDPANAWEAFSGGGEVEYRSKKAYPGPHVGGNLADSMIPLRMYGSFVDLRSPQESEIKKQKTAIGVYVGPGVKRDETTGRIHIRLRHTTLKGLGDKNYRGEIDPRKMKLVIASDDTALEIQGTQHLRLQDIVIRGASTAVRLVDSEGIEIDGVTLYAVRYGMNVARTAGLRVANSAFRGFDAPWHPRASGTDVDCFCPLDLVTVRSGSNIEFAYNEFTDHHDCIEIGDVDYLTFHHNHIDGFNDDGIDVDQQKVGKCHIYQNRISRCLTAFSIHRSSVASDSTAGFYIYRNIIDLRRGIYSHPPSSLTEWNEDDPKDGLNRRGRLIADHGSPIWPPLFFYHNTVLQKHPPYRAQYGSEMGTAGMKQTRRRVFNNVFVHHRLYDLKRKGFIFAQKPAEVDLQIDGNLFWGLEDHAGQNDHIATFRKSKAFEESKKRYPPGWLAHDLIADPHFKSLTTDFAKATDLTLQKGSPAVNAGILIPKEWPDSLRAQDPDSPDVGAVPFRVGRWNIGIHGRMSVFP